jgi:hypothetical protein
MGEWRYKYSSVNLGTRWKFDLLHAPTDLPPPPEKNARGTRWKGGWIGPRDGMDAVDDRTILQRWESNAGYQTVARNYNH